MGHVNNGRDHVTSFALKETLEEGVSFEERLRKVAFNSLSV